MWVSNWIPEVAVRCGREATSIQTAWFPSVPIMVRHFFTAKLE